MAGASQVISIVTPASRPAGPATATTHRRTRSDATHDPTVRRAAGPAHPSPGLLQAGSALTPAGPPLRSPSDTLSFSEDEDAELYEAGVPVIAGTLNKWTNYIHGWQIRYFVLKDGILSYFKSEGETSIGCRGAISINKAIVQLHDFDELRIDISLNDCIWYLRAETPQERQSWFEALELYKTESGYGSQGDLKRHGSLISLTSNRSITSISSCKKGGRGLKEKLAEMETFRDILCRQVDTLQSYFDACAQELGHGLTSQLSSSTLDETVIADDYESDTNGDANWLHGTGDMATPTLSNPLVRFAAGGNTENNVGPQLHFASSNGLPTIHAASAASTIGHSGTHAIDFRGEALTFKSTTAGILDTLQYCIDLIQQREEAWRRRLDKEVERRRRAEDALMRGHSGAPVEPKRVVVLGGPDFEEGPHCALNEEVWHDALDAALEKREMEDKRIQRLLSKRQSQVSLCPTSGFAISLPPDHPLYSEIEALTLNQLRYARLGVEEGVWELFSEDGEMKMYKREEEIDGLVCDPLKAVHSVRGVTAREYCHYFFASDYKMDWDTTLEYVNPVESPSEDTLVIQQVHKRVWPAAQRESLFWSHIRRIPELDGSEHRDTWIVCNKDVERDDVPCKTGSIRVGLTVAMVCSTVVDPLPPGQAEDEGEPPDRDRLTCKIIYVSQVNPGGWAPSSALRVIYKREYPKFLKRFTQFVEKKIEGKTPLF